MAQGSVNFDNVYVPGRDKRRFISDGFNRLRNSDLAETKIYSFLRQNVSLKVRTTGKLITVVFGGANMSFNMQKKVSYHFFMKPIWRIKFGDFRQDCLSKICYSEENQKIL